MSIDKQKLKALANEAQGQRLDWIDAGKPWPVWNSRLIDMHAKLEPETVLALLAEIERLEDSLHGASAEVHGLSLQLNRACRARDEAWMERDQLKAENEDYKSGQERYEQIIEDLKAENEALRKDAERYRWICDGNGYFLEESGLCGHGNEKAEADKEIDEAMAKEAE